MGSRRAVFAGVAFLCAGAVVRAPGTRLAAVRGSLWRLSGVVWLCIGVPWVPFARALACDGFCLLSNLFFSVCSPLYNAPSSFVRREGRWFVRSGVWWAPVRDALRRVLGGCTRPLLCFGLCVCVFGRSWGVFGLWCVLVGRRFRAASFYAQARWFVRVVLSWLPFGGAGGGCLGVWASLWGCLVPFGLPLRACGRLRAYFGRRWALLGRACDRFRVASGPPVVYMGRLLGRWGLLGESLLTAARGSHTG